MDEQDELKQLQALWQTQNEPAQASIDVAALMRSVRRKQWALLAKKSFEWLLFFGAVAIMIWAMQHELSLAMRIYVGFCCIAVPLVQWHYSKIRRLKALDLTRGVDAITLLDHARAQSQSELNMARFNLRIGKAMVWLGVLILPWFWFGTVDAWRSISVALWWYLVLLLNWIISRRRERIELARMAWLDREIKERLE